MMKQLILYLLTGDSELYIIWLLDMNRQRKDLSYFYPKRQVQDDEIHTKPLNL